MLPLYGQAISALYQELRGIIMEVYAAGDCGAPQRITEVMRDRHFIGTRI